MMNMKIKLTCDLEYVRVRKNVATLTKDGSDI